MPKEIDDFTVCGETWYSITQAEDIIKQLSEIRLWLQASEKADQDVLDLINSTGDYAFHLKRHLIDLQIKLLTVL